MLGCHQLCWWDNPTDLIRVEVTEELAFPLHHLLDPTQLPLRCLERDILAIDTKLSANSYRLPVNKTTRDDSYY